MKVEGNKKFIISSPKCPWDFGLVATLDYGSERGANSKFCIIDSFFCFLFGESIILWYPLLMIILIIKLRHQLVFGVDGD